MASTPGTCGPPARVTRAREARHRWPFPVCSASAWRPATCPAFRERMTALAGDRILIELP